MKRYIAPVWLRAMLVIVLTYWYRFLAESNWLPFLVPEIVGVATLFVGVALVSPKPRSFKSLRTWLALVGFIVAGVLLKLLLLWALPRSVNR